MNARDAWREVCMAEYRITGDMLKATAFADSVEQRIRAEALREAQGEVVAWLVKKASEGTPLADLASKADRGAIRIFLEAGEKATTAATTATPPLTDHLAALLAAILAHGGEWSTARVQALYRKSGPVAPLRATARKDLHALHAMGHLVHHDERGRQFYTLNDCAGGTR